MLYEKVYRETEERLHSKGYYVDNMVEPYDDCYEVYNEAGEIMIDHLSLAQLEQLSNML